MLPTALCGPVNQVLNSALYNTVHPLYEAKFWFQGMDGVNFVIKEQFYKGILWSFSYNSFVKIHGKKFGSHITQHHGVISRCVIKGLHSTLFNGNDAGF